MKNIRRYGFPPYKIALIHGGPGAAGEMATVAKILSLNFGVLELLQTKHSVSSQINELKKTLEKNTHLPAVIIGYSWGAWLGFIFTAKFPLLVKKLILVSSGPFEDKYANVIMPTRLKRLASKEKKELNYLMEIMKKLKGKTKNQAFKKIEKIISKADSFKIIPHKSTPVQADIYESVWAEASELRQSGNLLKMAKKIKVPVVAIHGDYDPHPAEGVRKPLSQNLANFKFILLKNCGHTPWLEREAKDKFFQRLLSEIE